jgi:5-methylthioadenosine/S-adenosylhomocysteine deaminase
MRTLIKNGYVLTLDDQDRVLETGDVLIEEDRIVRVESDIRCEAKIDRVIEAAGRLVMPGLIVAHAHSNENLYKGAFDNLPLELWMLYAYAPMQNAPLSQRLIYLRTLLGAMEMIKAGVTMVQDDVVSGWVRPPVEGIGTVFEAYRDVGMRATLSSNLTDKAFGDKTPFLAGLLPQDMLDELNSVPVWSPADYVRVCERTIAQWHGCDGRLNFMVAPVGPQWCTDDFLLRAEELSRRHGLPLHIHVLETKTQQVAGSEFYGTSLVRRLHNLGLLSPRTTLVHAIWMTDEDIKMLGDARCSVVHNPASNLKLGSGIMPLRRVLDAGVNVALGADGMSSNDSQNPFEAMKLAALLHKVSDPDFRKWPTSDEVLRMATFGGARSALVDSEVGAVAPGMKADIILLDLGAMSFTPLNSVKNQLVYCENGSAVETVIVNGKILVEEGEIRTVDERQVLEELRSHFDEFRRKFGPNEWTERLRPYLEEVYGRVVAMRTGLNRWAGDESSWVA